MSVLRSAVLGISMVLLAGVPLASAMSPDQTPDTDENARIMQCVERLRHTPPSTIMPLRQILRVRTDEQAFPIICRKVRKGLAEGRISMSDLSWSDGMSPMSMRLIRVLQGR